MPSAAQKKSLAEQIAEWHSRAPEAEAYWTSRNLHPQTIERFQLGYDGERLIIPYLTPAGAWYVKRRCIQDHNCKDNHCTKYLFEAGVDVHLFHASTLIDADRVVITEGEIDAMTVEQAGVPAVGYPGANNWKPHYSYCFDSAAEIVVLADGDDAGVKAANRVASSLRDGVHGDVRVIPLPAGEDANSFIGARGDEAFIDLLGWG